jgi:hypothetical protein
VHARSDQNERLKAFKKARHIPRADAIVSVASGGRKHRKTAREPAREGRPMRRGSRFVCALSGQAVNRVSGRIKQGQSPRTI